MKVYGRYGAFTPRPEQAGLYAKRAKKQKQQRVEAQRSLAAWLEKHRTCANGCGRDVAFYDTVHYSLRYGGCCSAECETEHRARQEAQWRGAIPHGESEAP